MSVTLLLCLSITQHLPASARHSNLGTKLVLVPQEYAKRPFRGFLERENWPYLGRVRVLQLKYLLRECEKSVKHMEAVVWEKNSVFMTVKSSSSRVGRLYAIWPILARMYVFVRNFGPYDKKKMEFLSQANLDVSHVLFVFLSWSAPRSGFTSLLFDVQLK